MIERILLVLAVLAVTPRSAAAQTVSDEKLWLAGKGEFDLSREASLDVTAGIRSGADSGLDQLRGEVGVSYRFTDYLAVAASYYLLVRDGYAPLETVDETRHRLAANGELRTRPKRFELSYRMRLQYTTYEQDTDHIAWRHKFHGGYRATKRVTPYAALELIYLFSPHAEYRETRFYLGVDWRFRKRTELGVYFMHQQETNVRLPEENNVLGVELTYTFRHVKKPDDEVTGTDPD